MRQGSGGYLQNLKSVLAKLKEICACTVVHLVVEIQARIYNAAKLRRLSTKFQVDTCRTKKDRSAVAHLVVEIQAMICDVARVRRLSTKFQVDTCKTKKRDLRMRSCASCSWDQGHDLWCGKGQEVMYKISSQYVKKYKFSFSGVILWGSGGLDCSQYQILTDPRNGLKNLCMQFGNDQSHRLGGVWWQTDRQTDRNSESLYALWYLRLLRRLDKNKNHRCSSKQYPSEVSFFLRIKSK